MSGVTAEPSGWLRGILITLVAAAALTRLYHINLPLLDGMSVKQIFVAHKARCIAGPPFDLLCNSFAFLDEEGHRMRLTEEIPLFTGLLAVSYRLFGEQEWLGRLMSAIASLVVLGAFYDLIKRRINPDTALLATALFSLCPLFLFYGRSVQSDVCMLACMLLTACCYDRYLENNGQRWFIAAALAAILAACFKYYGLMVLLPLAEMTYRRKGWRGWFGKDFVGLAVAMIAPVALWIGTVFLFTPNPSQENNYFIWQMPRLLVQPMLYERFLDRFLFKDCGVVLMVLILLGAGAALARRVEWGPIRGWTVLGLAFYFLLGPMFLYHDYYGLMLLPAAAVWGALGWQAFWRWPWWTQRGRVWGGTALLLIAAVCHSPWVKRGNFSYEPVSLRLAERLPELCAPQDRVLYLGRVDGVNAIHYARCEGWMCDQPNAAWLGLHLDRFRKLGAKWMVINFNDDIPPNEQEALRAIACSLPVVEHRVMKPCEYFIVRICNDKPTAAGQARFARQGAL